MVGSPHNRRVQTEALGIALTTVAKSRRYGPTAEILGITSRLRASWRSGHRPILGCVTSAAIGVAAVAQHVPGLRPALDRFGAESAGLPALAALLRMPGSLFLPTRSLPVWGALLQVILVVGLAEMLVGKWRTILVGLGTHAVATASARVMIAVGVGPFALPDRYLRVRDTGPSAAVVGLGVYLALRFRAWWSFAVGAMSLIVELVVRPNLAGREHIVAILGGAVAALIDAAVFRRRQQAALRRQPALR